MAGSKRLVLCMKKQASKTVWTMPGGTMTSTSTKCQAQFTVPELFDNRVVEWDLYVAPKMGAYDMIIGRDLLTDLHPILHEHNRMGLH
jgi:hypothetical protein